MLHGTSKACCYTTLLKLVAIRHLKAHCYTTLLQSLLLHGNIFYKISNCLQKPKYYLGNYLQNPNIILATIYKKPKLLWQLYFGIFYQKEKKKKSKTIGQTIILPKPKCYLAKELYYAQNLKLFFGKNIFWYTKSPNLWEV